MGHLSVTLVDDDGEKSTVKYPLPDLTVGNIAGILTDCATLVAALQNVTACVVTAWRIVTEETIVSTLEKSPNAGANREAAWLHRYADSTTFQKYTLTTPGPLEAHKLATNKKYADLANVTVDAYRDAFEALVKPAANAVVVNSMEWVGRNL